MVVEDALEGHPCSSGKAVTTDVLDDGIAKLAAGLTSVEEVARVVQEDG